MAAVVASQGAPDPTVCSPEQLAAIQEQLGVRLADTDQALLAHIADR